MPHVTFIHGIANKPPKEKLIRDWEGALVQGGLNLAASSVSTSMVYWADILHATPEATSDAYESVDDGLGTHLADEDLNWMTPLSGEEAAFVTSLREKLRFDVPSPGDDSYTPDAPPEPVAESDEDEEDYQPPLGFEAVPLPWFVKRRLMKRLLKDVYHYLFNKAFTPRPSENYQVQDHIRQLFVDQLAHDAAANADGKHIVISHSMGTVIAYDCLQNVPTCPSIDAFMTVGSPLGISEVFDNLKPGYSKNDGFPKNKVRGDWVNVFDRLDPVALDARISNDYRREGKKVITDVRVGNTGRWRHSSWKYFGQADLCDQVRRLLSL